MRSGTFAYEIRFPTTFILSFFLMGCVFLAPAFYVHIGTYINRGYLEAMLTAMTSLYVAPCESDPPVFPILSFTLRNPGIKYDRKFNKFLNFILQNIFTREARVFSSP